MRNRFNKFYKPVLLALTALTLAVCAFFAVFLGINNKPHGGQMETDTDGIIAETVADVSGKTSVALPSISEASKSSVDYTGKEQEFWFDYANTRVRITRVTYISRSPITSTDLYRYNSDGTEFGTNPFEGLWKMKATESGTYTVMFDLINKETTYWGTNADDTAAKPVSVNINQIVPVVNFTVAPGPYFTDDTELPAITLNAGSTPGTITWKEGQVPSTEPGDIPYEWNYTPDDANNYYPDGGSAKKYELHYQIDVIETVTIEWKDENDTVIYTTSSEDAVKSKIIVRGTYTSGKEVVVAESEYSFLTVNGANAWASRGERYLHVLVPKGDGTGNTESEHGLLINPIIRTALAVTFTRNDETKTYKATDSFDDIKENDLVVTAHYNDNNTEILKPEEYELKNKNNEQHPDEFIGAGTCTLVIKYQSRTAEFDVEVVLDAFDMTGVTYENVVADYNAEYSVDLSGVPEGVIVKYKYVGTLNDNTAYPETEDKPTDAGVYTVTASFEVDESKYVKIESTIDFSLTINQVAAQLGDIEIDGWTYGDTVSTPKVTTSVGNVSLKYYSAYSEEDETLNVEITAPTSLLDVGTYYVKAEVLSDNNIIGAHKTASFTITQRSITVKIDEAKTYKGENLATFTSAVTEGTIAEGNTEGDVYSLSSPADKDVAGIYTISGNVLNANYDITFEGGTDAYRIYQTISVGEGSLLGGQVDIPADGEFTLVVTAVDADKVYEGLTGDIRGFVATLYKAVGDDVFVTVTDVPTIVRLAVPEGMKDYKLYSVNGEGTASETEFNALEDGFIEIVYSGAFPMEFVYTAPIIKAPGLPWWVWLIALLVVIAIVAIIAEAAVRNKRPPRDDTAIIVEQIYNDEELKRILAEHGKRLADLEDRDDDGFNDPYEGGYNFG